MSLVKGDKHDCSKFQMERAGYLESGRMLEGEIVPF